MHYCFPSERMVAQVVNSATSQSVSSLVDQMFMRIPATWDSDRHEPVIGVVAFVPTFLDSGTIIGALPSSLARGQ